VSWSPELNFYLKHRKGVDDVTELDKRVKGVLHVEVAEFLCKTIRDDIKNWKGFHEPNVNTVNERGEVYVWWADRRFYNWEKGIGPGFELYLSANALLNPEEDDMPYLLLEFTGQGPIAGRKRAVVKKAVEKTKFRTLRSPWDDEPNFLAYERVDSIFPFNALDDRKELANNFLKMARKFSEIFEPVFPNYN
jgi:hypothetical protein